MNLPANISNTQSKRMSLLLTLLMASFLQVWMAGALTNEVYVWQRAWTEPVRAAVTDRATHFASLVVLSAEVTWHGKKPEVTHATVDYPTLAKTRTPVGLALRIGPYSGPFTNNDATITALAELAAALVAEA